MDSRNLAGLIGPTLVALSASEALNLHIWATNVAQVTYLNGGVLFVVGLAIVRAHSRWRGWPALVTATGWVGILGGLYRMFAPEAPQAGRNAATYAMFVALFGIGSFLSFKAYGPTTRTKATSVG